MAKTRFLNLTFPLAEEISMNSCATLLVVLIAACNLTLYGNPEPIKLHPLNNHYFQWRGNPMVLVTSGEHHGAICNSDFDYMAYLDELQSKGLNMTRVFTGIYSEYDFWCPNNTLGAAIGKLITPWVRDPNAGDCVISSGAGGGKKFNLNQWNTAYFDRLRDFLTQAANRGIVVELTLFCPFYNGNFQFSPVNSSNNVNGINYTQAELFNAGNSSAMNFAYAMVDKFVAELENYDNLWYEVVNEPYISGIEVSDAWQENITNRIVQQESNFTYKHLIARNICETCPTLTAIPNISIYNVHYGNYTQAQNNQSLNKVIGLDEDWDFPWYDDYAVRSYGWKWIMAGGGLYSHLDPTFQNGYWSGNGTELAEEFGRRSWGSAAIRAQLGYCNAFISSLPFISMAPRTSCIVSAPGGGSALALAQSGEAYAVYIYGGSTGNLTLNLPAASNYTATWISTITGSVLSTSSFSHSGGHVTLTSPSFSGDIALKVLAVAPVPVQLASFSGTVVHNGVRLDWRTISEVNNYGFYVQSRSREMEEWADVANSFVPGHGTTMDPHDYSFVDSSAGSGTLSYRLKQIDLDGTVHFTEAVTVDVTTGIESIDLPTSFVLRQNYPNPFNPTTTIEYELPKVSFVGLQLFDLLGRSVATLVSGIEQAGSKAITFDATGLSGGVYYYRLQAGGFSETRKAVLLK